MGHLLQGYQLCAATEGKSPNAIAIVTNSVSYFRDFLVSQGISTDITQISQHEIRAFILYLQQKRCFSGHRFNHTQDKGLSRHTINCYLRSIRIFWFYLHLVFCYLTIPSIGVGGSVCLLRFDNLTRFRGLPICMLGNLTLPLGWCPTIAGFNGLWRVVMTMERKVESVKS
jgi:hypothetical protein